MQVSRGRARRHALSIGHAGIIWRHREVIFQIQHEGIVETQSL
jgi:hypothetical protein